MLRFCEFQRVLPPSASAVWKYFRKNRFIAPIPLTKFLVSFFFDSGGPGPGILGSLWASNYLRKVYLEYFTVKNFSNSRKFSNKFNGFLGKII